MGEGGLIAAGILIPELIKRPGAFARGEGLLQERPDYCPFGGAVPRGQAVPPFFFFPDLGRNSGP